MKLKLFLRISALALVLATASGCSIIFDDGSEASSEIIQRPDAASLAEKYSGYGFKALQTVEEQRLYDAIDSAIYKNESKEFTSDSLDNKDKAGEVLELYKDDHPDIFWIDETEPYYYSDNGSEMTLLLTFKLSGNELAQAKTELDEKVNAALQGAPKEASSYEKELYAHDYIIKNCAYDEESVKLHKSDTVRANEQNAYGALVEGKAVCEGYTRAFQLLCHKLGVDCWVIQGQAQGFEGEDNTNHIWNCVQLYGEWYQVDVTWDDCDDTESALVTDAGSHLYFNITTAELEKDHKIAPTYSEYSASDIWYNGYVPQCDSTDYGYFTLNALAVDSIDSDNCAEYLAKAASGGAQSCNFLIGDSLDFDSAYDEIVQGYAYDWMTKANEINGGANTLSSDCKLSSYSDRRLIIMILDYE